MVQIERIIYKYYTSGLTLQPFVIVVGVSDDDIEEFFLYFNKNLVKCKSILYALEYPKASYDPWLFIQKYFFEIDTRFDKKSSNITALIDHLNK